MTATEPHAPVHRAEQRYAGHTRVSTQALASTARAVAAHAFGVPAVNVRVVLNDEFGSLALGLSLPLPIEALQVLPPNAAGRHAPGPPANGLPTSGLPASGLPEPAASVPAPQHGPGHRTLAPIWDRARDARAAIRDRFTELTGARVSRVDVRVTGIVLEKTRRVV